MKTKILFLISFLVISGLFLSNNVLAQETETGDVEEVEEIEEVVLDEDITAEDLGISDPKLLPDSPFYFLKNFWRGVKTILTFDEVKKAELQLQYANQRLIEVRKLAEEIGEEEIIQKALEKYQQEMERIRNRVEALGEKAEDNPKIDKFLDKYIDKVMKQQRLMNRLEKQLADKPEVLETIRENKERALEHFGGVLEKLEDADKIPERLEKNLEEIEGSKYKNFKNLEVLLELEEKIPEQAKEAIQQAQQNALKRLQGDLEKMSPEDQEKFSEYLEKIGGDQALHLRILERLKEKELLPALERKIEQNREKVQERVQAIEKDAEQLRERIQERIQEQAQEQTGEQTQEQIREQAREQVCIALWDPVCGKDGKTYSNACFAKLAGVEIAYRGKCGTCAKEKERVNRNPLLGPIDRKCCSGLKEVRVSKSYSVCEAEVENPNIEPIPKQELNK